MKTQLGEAGAETKSASTAPAPRPVRFMTALVVTRSGAAFSMAFQLACSTAASSTSAMTLGSRPRAGVIAPTAIECEGHPPPYPPPQGGRGSERGHQFSPSPLEGEGGVGGWPQDSSKRVSFHGLRHR